MTEVKTAVIPNDQSNVNDHILTYINKELEHNSPKVIKKQLISYGYKKEDVESNVERIVKERSGKSTKEISLLQKLILFFTALILLLFLLWIVLTVESPPFNVFIGFLPTILCFVITLAIVENYRKEFAIILWPLPIVLALIFYVIGEAHIVPALAIIDIGSLAFLNTLISMSFVFAIQMVGIGRVSEFIKPRLEIQERATSKSSKEAAVMESPADNAIEKAKLREYIQSIEDKCKAINFVIGRVYSKKHGGSEEIRKKISIDKKLYNAFADPQANLQEAKRAVHKIKHNLELLDMKERDVFGEVCFKFTNITRHPTGDDTIFEVLKKNDDDPIDIYVKSAKDFCSRAMQALSM